MRVFLISLYVLAFCGMPALADKAGDQLKLGVQSYKNFCSHCHGLDMINPGTSSYDLRKWPTRDKEGFVTSVLKGKGDMPAWGDVLLDEEVEALWRYVATRGGTAPFPIAKTAD